MKQYIHENKKFILSTILLLCCTVVLLKADGILAQRLPYISELTLSTCVMENEISEYSYTEGEITPTVGKVVLQNEDGEVVVKEDTDITIVGYSNNLEIGYADVEVSLKGYQGTLLLPKAFRIGVPKVQKLQVSNATREFVELTWKAVPGAEGYLVYKRIQEGAEYELLQDVPKAEQLICKDTNVQLNAKPSYYVCAYTHYAKEQWIGAPSETVIHQTPLAIPKITEVSCTAYNQLRVKWNLVNGAVGYEVYRSDSSQGEYTCVAKLKDGTLTAYYDTNLDCGKTYYYYIKANQNVNGTWILGDASNTMYAQTKPNSTSLSGTQTETSVNLKWSVSSGAQGFELYRSVGSTSNFKLVKKFDNTSTLNWSESGLDKHTSYFYRIRPYRVVDGATVYGYYSGSYEKVAVIEYNYSGGGEVDVLRQYVGRPYVYGGTSPTRGWDCSSFVQYVYRTHFGVELPRTSGQQSGYGTTVNINNRSAWKPGDLIFYRSGNGYGSVSHVSIYLGDGMMIHALSPKHDTFVQSVDQYEVWDENKMYCVKRVLK